MLVTFSFNVPEEDEEYSITAAAQRMHSFISEYADYLRNQQKYPDPDLNLDQRTIEVLRDIFWETINEHGIGELL